MGGTFVITTARPNMHDVDARGPGVEFGHGRRSGNSWGWDATVSVPIVQDKLALRRHRRPRQFRRPRRVADRLPAATSDIDNYDQTNERAKLRWEATDALSVTATYWHTEENRNFSPGIYATVDPPLILGTGGKIGVVEQDTDFASDTGRLGAIVRPLDQRVVVRRQPGTCSTANFAFDTVIAGQLFNNVLQLTVPGEGRTRTTRSSACPRSEMDPGVGLFGSEYTSRRQGDNSVISAFRAGPLVGVVPDSLSANRGDSKSWSVFGEVSREFLDGKLTPLIGLRYFRDEPEVHSVTNFPPSVYTRTRRSIRSARVSTCAGVRTNRPRSTAISRRDSAAACSTPRTRWRPPPQSASRCGSNSTNRTCGLTNSARGSRCSTTPVAHRTRCVLRELLGLPVRGQRRNHQR